MKFIERSELPPAIVAYFAGKGLDPDEPTLILPSQPPFANGLQETGNRSISATDSATITEAVLAGYAKTDTAAVLPDEEELLRPLPETDWEVLRPNDRNPW